MTTIWICEKPSSRNALAKVLGIARDNTKGPFGHYVVRNGDIITNNIGHLLDKVPPAKIDEKWATWKYDSLPITPSDIPLEPDPGKRQQLSHIEKLFKDVRPSQVVLAGDAGREGSRIGRETVVDWIGYKGPLKRMAIVSYDEPDIRQSIKEMDMDPGAIDRDYRADLEAKARGIYDYWLGMTGSVIATLKLKPAELGFKERFNAGGVISALTKLIVDRERAIRDHVPKNFHHVVMKAATAGSPAADLTLKYAPGVVPKTNEDRRLYDANLAERLKTAAEAWKGPLKVESKAERVGPPLLLDKAGLAAKAAKAFGWNPSKTAEVAQSLYSAGYISYPRGECIYLKNEQVSSAGKILNNLATINEIGPVLKPLLDADKIVIRKGSRYNSSKVGEHYATVPTGKFPNLGTMSPDQRALYVLIAKNFAANHMPDAVDDVTRISAAVPLDGKNYDFQVTGRVPKEAGWRAIYGAEIENAESLGKKGKVGGAEVDNDETGRLPVLADGTAAKATGAEVKVLQTTPPPRYQMGDLEEVMKYLIDQFDNPKDKALLDNPYDPDMPKGLGTAATRDEAIRKVQDLDYIEPVKAPSAKAEKQGGDPGEKPKKGKKDSMAVRPTAKGESHVLGWEQKNCDLLTPIGRAILEGKLAEIGSASSNAESERKFDEFLKLGQGSIAKLVEDFRDARPARLPEGVEVRLNDGPSKAQVDLAKKLSKEKGLKPSDVAKKYGPDWATDRDTLKKMIDEMMPPKADQRPPSEKQAAAIRAIAEKKGLDPELVTTALANAKAAGGFLDQHMEKRDSAEGGKGGSGSSRPAGTNWGKKRASGRSGGWSR